jgi:hypothetical protein
MAATFYNNNKNHFDYIIIRGGFFSALSALAFIIEWPDVRII